MDDKINKLLTKLADSISKPEANTFEFQIRNGNTPYVQKFLKNFFNDEDSNFIIDYYNSEFNSKKNLVEVLDYSELKPFDKILVNYGGEIFKSYIEDNSTYERLNGTCFYSPKDSFLSISKATQIWKIEKYNN